MRAVVVSDLHANAEALRTVLSRVRRKKFDTLICLGDFVGYGAEPNQVVDTMRTLRTKKLYIRGNHDRVAAAITEGGSFHPAAQVAAEWTRKHLSAPNRRFLEKLPLGPLKHDSVLLCHGSPHDEDEYVFNEYHAAQIFASTDARIVLYGHTHLPAVFSVNSSGDVEGELIRGEKLIRLDGDRRYLINPGSVGQPRDRDRRASFAIVDVSRMTAQFFRVPYNVRKTQAAILKAGLPVVLANRLQWGT
ncbi:MAG TPA: metallophosphoesterase family protein [Thermoanaerobaculia bacterium]|nr:metallophosphoesterase family protein [Thermoanaerobaculia bacterium]